ncbi:MAG TPA: T9SS type A sorting domain-containing protein [Bacteroidales bacterium]|nr:T9SS type A sorting domain-containing protein [Bacteroidales bacterium]
MVYFNKNKRLHILLILLLFTFPASSQLFYNNGALVAVKSAGIVQVNGSVQNTASGSLDNAGAMTITGDLTNNATAGGNGTINLAGNWINNNTFNSGTGTVVFNGSASQSIGGSAVTTFNNLIVNNSGGGIALNNIDAAINSTLTLTMGNFNVSTRILTLASGAAAVAGSPFSAANMVIANQGGELRKNFSSLGSYFFPVGDNSGTAEYSPISVSVTSGTGFIMAYVGIKVNDIKHPDNHAATNYLNRYWSVTQSGVLNFQATITANYVNADIAGTETSIKSAQLKGVFNQLSNPWIKYSFLSSNTLTAAGASLTPAVTSVFTGISGTDPSVSITGGGVTVCQGENVTLTAVPANANPAVVYAWSGGLGSNASVTPSTLATGTTIYTVTITDGNGITATTSTSVTVAPTVGTPVFDLGPSSSRCQGAGIVAYTATATNNSGLTYSLDATSLGAGNSINSSTGEVTYTTGWTGTSTVTVTATGCNGPVTAPHTITTSTGTPVSVTISQSPSGPVCSGTLVDFTATPVNGGTSPVYQWMVNGSPAGGNSPSFSSSTLSMGDHVSCQLTSNASCLSGNPDTSNVITMIVKPSLPAGISITASANPACSHTIVDFAAAAVNGGTTPAYQWYLNNTLVGTNSTYSNNSLSTGDSVQCKLTSNEACVVNNPALSNTIHMVVSPLPTVEAGATATYTVTPVQIGDPLNGPGIISWSPPAGLSDPLIAQPLASPVTTITYTLTVNNSGCIATDTVTVIYGGIGHNISGKTRYAGKANAGNPVPNMPTYNAVIYAIDKVIVVLKTSMGDEVTRDTSDALGNYQFTNIADGNYILSYDKYTVDTMQWGNDVNAIDVALLKYFVGSDTLTDPTRCFSSKYKKAANVDNNLTINAIDVARIKAKIGSPYDVVKNFPKGNWVALTENITLAGSDLTVNLETICYGDYNASSSKYRDSLNTWSGAKSLTEGFIYTSDETVSITNPFYFEVPFKVNTKVNDFSALGLELTYSNTEYKLVSAYMPGTKIKSTAKINPSLEEIIANDNDLLVTDDHGTIRVVYATTNHYDVAPNDEMIVLGFRALKDMQPGEVDFTLSGTGVIGNQFGEENEDTYLLMPKVYVQGTTDAGFEISGYPNPFSNEATITYTIPENGTVTLNVYNVIGELVAQLVNEQQGSGKHSVAFSSKNLPEGLYTFNLQYAGPDKIKCLVLKMIH